MHINLPSLMASLALAAILLCQPAGAQPVAGSVLWLDADDPATLTTSGSTVTAWSNKGSGGGSATPTGGNSTLAASAMNSRPAVFFNNSSLGGVYNNTGGTMSLFLVIRWSTNPQDRGPMGFYNNPAACNQASSASNLDIVRDDSGKIDAWRNWFGGGTFIRAQVVQTAETYIVVLIYDGSGGPATLRVIRPDGSVATDIEGPEYGGTNPAFNVNRFVLGGRQDGCASVQYGWSGHIAELAVYNSALNTTDRSTMESYLAQKWQSTSGETIVTVADDLTWTDPLAWSNNQAPSPLNDYVVLDGFGVRTPGTSTNPATFGGKSLQVDAGGKIQWKRTGVITIDDLRLNGGTLTHAATGDDQIGRLTGNINVLATSFLNGTMSSTSTATNIATPRQIEIRSPMTNSGGISITTAKAGATMRHRGYIVYSTVAKDYQGDTVIEGRSSAGAGGLSDVGATLRVLLENALPYGAGRGNLIIQQDGTLNLGGFNTTVNGLSGAGWVANLEGTGNTSGLTPTGTAAAPATLTVLGTLSPGESMGTLTFLQNAGLALDAGSATSVEIDAATPTNDVVVVGGDMTYAGTLAVTNLAGTLAAGQSYPLFNVSGSSTGNFSSISPATPGPNLAWEFNPLTGTLSVVSTGVTPPTMEYAITTTNTIVVSWSGIGFQLQAQTNAAGAGLGTDWGDYPGGTGSPVIVPIDPASGSVFLRLVSP